MVDLPFSFCGAPLGLGGCSSLSPPTLLPRLLAFLFDFSEGAGVGAGVGVGCLGTPEDPVSPWRGLAVFTTN